MKMFAVKDDQGLYLVSTSRSYGSQGGTARVWSEDSRKAMRWLLKGEALYVVQKEFDDMAERLGIQVVLID